jgi:hypothetical protein
MDNTVQPIFAPGQLYWINVNTYYGGGYIEPGIYVDGNRIGMVGASVQVTEGSHYVTADNPTWEYVNGWIYITSGDGWYYINSDTDVNIYYG